METHYTLHKIMKKRIKIISAYSTQTLEEITNKFLEDNYNRIDYISDIKYYNSHYIIQIILH